MSDNPIEIKIKKLEERRLKDEAQLKRLRAKNRKSQRTADTRRKILLGSWLIREMEKPETLRKVYPALMDYLKKEQDRKLFNQQWISIRYSKSKNGRRQSDPNATK